MNKEEIDALLAWAEYQNSDTKFIEDWMLRSDDDLINLLAFYRTFMETHYNTETETVEMYKRRSKLLWQMIEQRKYVRKSTGMLK